MIDDEIRNSHDLASLLESSGVRFMPISPVGESFNMYGENVSQLIRIRISLMEKHRNDIPRIDPDFMWKLPPGVGIPLRQYLKD